jgi:hypothetical protein
MILIGSFFMVCCVVVFSEGSIAGSKIVLVAREIIYRVENKEAR